MYSKIISFLIFTMSLILLSSCSWMKEDKSPLQIIEKGEIHIQSSSKCFDGFFDSVSQYLEGGLSQDKVEYYMSCLQSAFLEYLKHVEGEQKDIYTILEVKNFLKTYYLKEKSSDTSVVESHEKKVEALIEVTFVLKKALLGGSTSKVTRLELEKVIHLIGKIKNILIDFSPFTIWLTKEVPTVGTPGEWYQVLGKSIPVLEKSVDSLLEESVLDRSGYTMQDLRVLIENYYTFFKPSGKENEAFYNLLEKRIDFLKEFKSITLGGSKELILPQEWKPLLKSLIKVYGSFMRYKYILKPMPKLIFDGIGFDTVKKIYDELYYVLDSSLKLQKDNVIPFEEIDKFVKQYMSVFGPLPFKISADSFLPLIKNLITKSFGNILTPVAQRNLIGVNELVLTSVKSEFQNWYQLQQQLILMYREKVSVNRLASNGAREKSEELSQGLRLLNKVHPMLIDNCESSALSEQPRCQGVRLVSDVRKEWSSDQDKFDQLSYMNLYRMLSRFLIRSYATDSSRALSYSGLTSEELQSFYMDFREVGRELQSVNPTTFNSGKRSFMEGSLFLFNSRGVQVVKKYCDSSTVACSQLDMDQSLLSMEELMELSAFSFSSNIKGKIVYHEFEKRCQADENHKGVYGLGSIAKDCVLENAKEVYSLHLQNLETMSAFIQRVPEFVFRDFLHQIFLSVSQKDNPIEFIELGEFVTAMGIIQYIDALMVQFDSDKDQRLKYSELKSLYQRFDSFMWVKIEEKILKDRDEHEHQYDPKDISFWDSLKNYVYVSNKEAITQQQLNWMEDYGERERAFFFMLKKKRFPTGMELLQWDRSWSQWGADPSIDSKSIELTHFGLMQSFIGIADSIKNKP